MSIAKEDLFALSLVEGVGATSIQNILNAEISISDFDEETLSEHIKGPKKAVGINAIVNNFSQYQEQAEHQINELESSDIHLICCTDSEYPYLYRNIAKPPIFLYARGNLELLNYEKNIAIIGARQCSPFGKDIAKKTAKRFVEAGYNIVSGLALGIDTAAHELSLIHI